MKIIEGVSLFDLLNLVPEHNSALNLLESREFCEKMANAHYENFPVGSILIPKKYRHHIYALYCFARLADDIADESNLEAISRINALNSLEVNLKEALIGVYTTNPIFICLIDAFKQTNLDIKELLKLLDAFRSDINFQYFADWDALLDYCKNSANPIGRCILQIFGEDSQTNLEQSDKICSALQLINFWQDVSLDSQLGRVYFPLHLLKSYNLKVKDFEVENINKLAESFEFEDCLDEVLNYTEAMMFDGMDLIKKLNNKRLRIEIALISEAGLKILNRIRRYNVKVVSDRPSLSKLDYVSIVMNTFLQHKIIV